MEARKGTVDWQKRGGWLVAWSWVDSWTGYPRGPMRKWSGRGMLRSKMVQ